MNLKNCKAAVSRFTKMWAKEASVDRRVLRDWEETGNKFIDENIRCLEQRQVNKRKKHVLKSRVHLDNLNKLHENFVLEPADKASNNVIVVCKKYYLDVVIKELSFNNTYKEVLNNNVNVISRHLEYRAKNGIDVLKQHEQLSSFYWLHKLHKNYSSRFIAATNKYTTKLLPSLLTSCFKTILTHYKQYCDVIYNHRIRRMSGHVGSLP